MIPPHCFCCDATYKDKGVQFTLITFVKQTPNSINMLPVIGQQNNQVWFCNKHAYIGEKYKHTTFDEFQKNIML